MANQITEQKLDIPFELTVIRYLDQTVNPPVVKHHITFRGTTLDNNGNPLRTIFYDNLSAQQGVQAQNAGKNLIAALAALFSLDPS